jgi:hypothetical protein
MPDPTIKIIFGTLGPIPLTTEPRVVLPALTEDVDHDPPSKPTNPHHFLQPNGITTKSGINCPVPQKLLPLNDGAKEIENVGS